MADRYQILQGSDNDERRDERRESWYVRHRLFLQDNFSTWRTKKKAAARRRCRARRAPLGPTPRRPISTSVRIGWKRPWGKARLVGGAQFLPLFPFLSLPLYYKSPLQSLLQSTIVTGMFHQVESKCLIKFRVFESIYEISCVHVFSDRAFDTFLIGKTKQLRFRYRLGRYKFAAKLSWDFKVCRIVT